MKNKSILLTTAQFAKLHHLNKRTLHYYDDIGLFSPQYKGENNYRYYDFFQSFELENILMLKELNMSIAEMKDYMQHPNETDFMRIADFKLIEVEETIQKLQQLQSLLTQKKEQMSLCQQIQESHICIRECNEAYLFTAAYDFAEDDHQKLFDYLKQVWDIENMKVGCGSYIAIEKLQQGDFEHYDGLYTPIQKKSEHMMLRPKGRYLCGYIRGEWQQLPQFYTKIFAYAKAHQLELTGYAYEMGLNEFAIEDMQDYVTQIMIQIKN